MFDVITYALAKKYTDNKIAEKLTSVYNYKGSVETFSDLDYYSSTAKIGDTYNVLDEGGQNYAWNGTTWDSLGVNQDATNERKGLIKLTDNVFTDTTFDGNTTFTSGEITSTLEKAFEDLFGERIDFSKGVEKLSNLSTYDGWLFDNMNQDQPFFDITDGVISTIVPANGSASPNYSSQVVYKPITLTANKYYTAEVTLKSSIARRFQLLIQSDGSAGGDRSAINEESIFEVEANETYTFSILFRATNVTNPYLFGLMCGHIEGDPATVGASSVEISGFSLKEYATSPILNIETIKQYVDAQDDENTILTKQYIDEKDALKQDILIAGTNITIDSDGKTISATDTTYDEATTNVHGLMSAEDKAKLNGIATGAEVNVQADWSESDSTSDAYIKNKPTIPTVPVTDVKINNTTIVSGGVANIGANETGGVGYDTTNNVLKIVSASGGQCRAGSTAEKAITPSNQHQSVFYGLAKASGDTTQANADTSLYPVGTYTDDAKEAIQQMIGILSVQGVGF